MPFLEQVPLPVQVDLLAETWARHRNPDLVEASLLNAAVVYAACETAGRLIHDMPEVAHAWLQCHPRKVPVTVNKSPALRPVVESAFCVRQTTPAQTLRKGHRASARPIKPAFGGKSSGPIGIPRSPWLKWAKSSLGSHQARAGRETSDKEFKHGRYHGESPQDRTGGIFCSRGSFLPVLHMFRSAPPTRATCDVKTSLAPAMSARAVVRGGNGVEPGWQRVYQAGQTDPDGHYLGGSNIIHVVGHKGKLYAGNSYWCDSRNVRYGGTDPKTGWAQVLRLDQPGGKWVVNLELGPKHLRTEILKSVTFRTDGAGRRLEEAREPACGRHPHRFSGPYRSLALRPRRCNG